MSLFDPEDEMLGALAGARVAYRTFLNTYRFPTIKENKQLKDELKEPLIALDKSLGELYSAVSKYETIAEPKSEDISYKRIEDGLNGLKKELRWLARASSERAQIVDKIIDENKLCNIIKVWNK